MFLTALADQGHFAARRLIVRAVMSSAGIVMVLWVAIPLAAWPPEE
jgi:hypothetical protein